MPLNLNRFFLKEGTDLNFFQAVYLLERIFRGKSALGTGDDLGSEPIRFETLNSLGFPPAEVAAVLPPLSFRSQAEELETAKRGDEPPPDPDALPPIRDLIGAGGGPLRISLTFMGLYGVSSPLPSYFVDPVTLRKIEYFELKKFLDIFSHRIYSLYYRSWKKYRHYAQFRPELPDDYTLRLLALTGQWPRRIGKVHVRGESAEFNLLRIPYARFLGNRVRSAKGLQQLLRGYFGFERVKIRQFQSNWVEIPVKASLGDASVKLGRSMRLGDRMQDRLSRFTVEIGPMPRSQFNRFLPPPPEKRDASVGRSALAEQVRELIDAYLRDPLEYRIKVILQPEEGRNPVLGSENSRMGMGIWLGDRPLGEVACMV